MPTFDLIVKGGTVVDSTGAPARTADVAVADGHIVAVGEVDGDARRTVDADGLRHGPRLEQLQGPPQIRQQQRPAQHRPRR